ncbi:MAG: hypothetical protein EPN97_17610 [Alphaproteobacteria bacterium]|nr:MAG: hypothetical protein EPN97_17610 [Alphaproteobacteria bacterium]
MQDEKLMVGYYTVRLDIGGRKIPYIVFADSEYQAAHKIRMETGLLPAPRDIDGPYSRPMR